MFAYMLACISKEEKLCKCKGHARGVDTASIVYCSHLHQCQQTPPTPFLINRSPCFDVEPIFMNLILNNPYILEV